MRWKPTGEIEINIGVLGNSNDVLWEFRDFLVGLEAESNYRISMMLAKDQETILRVMSFIPEGFDIMIVTDCQPDYVYSEIAEKALKSNAEVRILFQINMNVEFVDKLYPHILYVSDLERIKILIEEKINHLIAERIAKEEKQDE